MPVGVTLHGTDGTARVASYDELAQCLRARAPGHIDNSSTTIVQQPMAHAFDARQSDVIQYGAVRRLTPRECERLQGFPDNYTLIPYRGKPAADGPRYKSLGNSWAVPVVRWIGSRIEAVEAIRQQREAA